MEPLGYGCQGLGWVDGAAGLMVKDVGSSTTMLRVPMVVLGHELTEGLNLHMEGVGWEVRSRYSADLFF